MNRKLSNHFAETHFNHKNEILNIQSKYIVSKFFVSSFITQESN